MLLRKLTAVALALGGIAAVVIPALAVGGHFEAPLLADPDALWSVRVWGRLHYMPNAPTLINYMISICGVCSFVVGMFKCENEWSNNPLFR